MFSGPAQPALQSHSLNATLFENPNFKPSEHAMQPFSEIGDAGDECGDADILDGNGRLRAARAGPDDIDTDTR